MLGRGRCCLALAVAIALTGSAGLVAAVEVASTAAAPAAVPATLISARPIIDTVRTALGFLACGPVPLGMARCASEVVTSAAALATEPHAVGAQPRGYGPADLQSAYRLASASSTSGAGRTVAVVAAYDDPNVEADLAVYRAAFGLPACTSASGCFTRVDQYGRRGRPGADVGWASEISLDVQMVSATCPLCRILLVEAYSPSRTDLGTAVNTAARLGAVAISNSYGGNESPGQLADDARYFNHPGIAVTASSGDSGLGPQYPASSPHVTAVGGTTLRRGGGAWTESAWAGSGSGCSAYEPAPTWQAGLTACSGARSVADVAAVADPMSGVAVYDSFGASPGVALLCQMLKLACPTGGWEVIGGTSVSSPIIAGVYALAGRAVTAASYPYGHTGALTDIVSGTNDVGSPGILGLGATLSCGNPECTAGPGYDGPTGLGTPAGVGGF